MDAAPDNRPADRSEARGRAWLRDPRRRPVLLCGLRPRTQWYRNLLADSRVEVVLPGAAFAGLAEVVTDSAELDRAWRALIRSLGVLGRTFICAPEASPDELMARTANLPLIRIRSIGLAGGPADPGGWLWVTLTVAGSPVWRSESGALLLPWHLMEDSTSALPLAPRDLLLGPATRMAPQSAADRAHWGYLTLPPGRWETKGSSRCVVSSG